MHPRQRASWTKESAGLWCWGDWTIAEMSTGYWLVVSSGVEYGPFRSKEAAESHAESVRGD
jgi:hypothetical protein